MKKLVLGGFAVAALAVAGWTAFWFVGRGSVETALDAEIARYDDRGWTVSYGTRSISGFPFGYQVRLGDVGMVRRENGTLIRTPSVEADWAASDGQQIRLRVPGDVSIDLPVTQFMLLRDPSLPSVLKVVVQNEGLELLVDGTAQGSFAGQAGLLRLRLDQEDYHARVDLWAEGARFEVQPEGDGGRFTLSATRLIQELEAAEPGAAPFAMRMDLGNLSLDSAASSVLSEALSAILEGDGPGHATLDYTYGEMTFDLDVDESEFGGFQGRLSARSGGAQGRVDARDGQMAVEAESADTVWSVVPANDALPVRGAIEIGRARYAHSLPLGTSDAVKPARVDLAVSGLRPDDELWQRLDGAGVLDRGPMAIEAALDLRLKAAPEGRGAVGAGGFGYEVSGVGIEALSITALGAGASATGDVDILQPIGIPLGEMSVKATGLVKLIGDLEKAGLIGPDMRQMGDAILQVYARPGDGPDSWQSDLSFATEGITVNGVPLQ